MGFWSTVGRIGLGVATGGASELHRATINAANSLGLSGGQGPEVGAPKTISVYDDGQRAIMKRLQEQAAQGVAPQTLGMEQAQKAQASPQFSAARSRLNDQFNRASQTSQDALSRRFASLGGLNSGSAIKAMQNAREEAERQRGDQLQQLDAQEATDMSQRQFAAEEATRGRNLQREQFNASQDFQSKVFSFDSQSKLAGLDLAYKSAENDRLIGEYNKALNAYQARHSGGLLGAGGILGTGIGT